MKIRVFELQNGDVPGSFKKAVLSALIGYKKMYELLHKQLWDKDRLQESGGYTNYDNSGNVIDYTPGFDRVVLVDAEITLNNRPAKPIDHWNIQSWSINPYSKTDLYALGLNQLFMGQSPYDKYEGDPKDGIYHDICWVQPKKESVQKYNIYKWVCEGVGEWMERDYWGVVQVTNVYTYEKTHEEEDEDGNTTTVSDGYYCVVEYPDGSSEETSIGDEEIPVSYIDSGVDWIYVPNLESVHGNIIYQTEDSELVYILGLVSKYAPCKTVVYEDGSAYKYVTEIEYIVEADEGSMVYTGGGYQRFLPLVYTDTGDLVQNRVDFVDSWDEQFELYVHEDGYWYSGLIQIAVVVVSVVVAIYTGLGVAGVLGAFISSVGAMSGNKIFQIIGAALTLGATLASEGSKVIAQEAMAKGLSERTANQIAMEATLKETFGALLSGAGLGNLSKIGSNAFSLYSAATTPEIEDINPEDDSDEDGMVVYASEDNEEDYIQSVLEI